MARLINPRAYIKIYGSSEIEITKDNQGLDYFLEFEIEKDLEEEPNVCDLTIYNLNPDTRSKIAAAANQSAPIEVYVTPSGIDTLAKVFVGEIDYARNSKMLPGHETFIHAESQKTQHRNIFFEKNYAKGKPINEIIGDMVAAINLPAQIADSSAGEIVVINRKTYTVGGGVPTTGILVAQKFSGPAFPLLRRYCFDLGLYCYIVDGVLHISSVYNAQDTATITIEPYHLLLSPKETTRTDEELIEQRTIVESVNIDPLRKIRKRKKKKIKVNLGKGDTFGFYELSDAIGEGDYSEYEAVDMTISGFELKMVLKPEIQPDSLLIVNTQELKNKLLRVREVRHEGNTEDFSEWSTSVEADAYDESEYGVDTILGLPGIPVV